MADNEIIKALENEVKSTEYVDSDYCDGVDLTLIKSAIDLTNRQKAEIKRLKGIFISPSKDPMDFCGVLCNYAEELIDKAKAEAYKNFAERLKQKSEYYENGQGLEGRICYVDDIDNLVKEYEKGSEQE